MTAKALEHFEQALVLADKHRKLQDDEYYYQLRTASMATWAASNTWAFC